MAWQHYFRTKALEDESESEGQLPRCLSAFDLTLLGIGAIIGTGIFVLTGIAAATQAGPALVLSFVISGFVCALAALAYAELAACVGGSGSAYGYCYAAFGELIAWIIGWDLLLEYAISVAAVANGWAGYFCEALTAVGLPLPVHLTRAPDAGGWFNLPAASIILLLMGLLILGARESARINAVMVGIKLITITVFMAVASQHVDPALWHPFMPFGWYHIGDDGRPVGVLAGASVVFFAYVGFDAVSTATEEAKNPRRDIPLGIVGALTFCTIIYIAVSLLLTGVVHYGQLNVASPVAHALELLGIHWASALVASGVIAGLTTVMLVLYYALTRIIYAMARDGLLSPWLSVVGRRYQSPVRVIIPCGLLMALLAGLVPLGELAELVNIGTLFAFVLVSLGVIWLRHTRPDAYRPFRMPATPWLPLLGAVACLALTAFLPLLTWLRFGLWLLLGLVIYFSYSCRHSRLARS